MTFNSVKDLVDEIKTKVDIATVVGSRVKLNRSNMAVCPFHDDTNPSLSVSVSGQYFNCFGCGAGGDCIRFVLLHDKTDFWGAVEILSNEYGLSFQLDRENGSKPTLDDKRPKILTVAAAYYQSRLTSETREYLRKDRGLLDNTIERFQLGYADGGLTDHLTREAGFSPDDCVAAGVSKRGDNGEYFDFFRKRIIVPNEKWGLVFHLTGRTVANEVVKYLHLPGPINHLFNEQDLYSDDSIIVEGVFDCMQLVQNCYKSAALYGLANFELVEGTLSKACKRGLICLDGDNAGKSASSRFAHRFGDRISLIQLPNDADPDSFLRENGKIEFDKLVQIASPGIQYLIESIPPDCNKVELSETLQPVIDLLKQQEPVIIDAYLNHTIKERFCLKTTEVNSYRKLLRKSEGITARSQEATKSNPDITPKMTAEFTGLVEIAEENSKSVFLVKEGERLLTKTEVYLDGVKCIPPRIDQIPWRLPRAEMVLEQYEQYRNHPRGAVDRQLYYDLRDYLFNSAELPCEAMYDFVCVWILHTYLIDNAQYSPIICLFALPERGKSRLGKSLIYACRRGVHVESLRDSYIIRLAENFQAAIFFDVMNIWKRAENAGSEDVILHRYERGAKVPRVMYPDKGAFNDTVYYKIFGPTIVATNVAAHHIFDSRALQINMPETNRTFENDITPERAQELKERLTAFRAFHMATEIPRVQKPAKGRLGDITRPLLEIAQFFAPEATKNMLEVIKDQLEGRKTEMADSLEAEAIRAVQISKNEVSNGHLLVSIVLDQLNGHRAENHKITPQKLGRLLKSMGFRSSRVGTGTSAILWSDDLVESLLDRFGLKLMSETSESSEMSSNHAGVSELSEVSELSNTAYPNPSSK